MNLTPEERSRWEAFKKQHCHDKPKVERVKKIIEMSEAGVSIKDIYSEVGGNYSEVTETRMRGRRQGAY